MAIPRIFIVHAFWTITEVVMSMTNANMLVHTYAYVVKGHQW